MDAIRTDTRTLVALVHDDDPAYREIKNGLTETGFTVSTVLGGEKLHEVIYTQFPQCLILTFDWRNSADQQLLQTIKSHNIFGHLPIIGIFKEKPDPPPDWTDFPMDDYIVEPVDLAELVSRIRLCLARNQRDVNANPLTGLPGNLTIMREAERRLAKGEPFALAHFDIDHFKAFNDTYGFNRGDEVLRMTSMILKNTLEQQKAGGIYVGQIGGDDFVFITPPGVIRGACENIIRNFDQIVLNFYDEEHRQQGCIRAVNRKGEDETYPLMNCSIAVVVTGDSAITHIADVSARVNDVKKYTKSLPGSNFVIDRRK